MRPGRLVLVVALAAAGIVVALAVGRVLAANGDERGALDDLVAAEARGDARAVGDLVDRCAGGCARLVAGLRRSGRVEVLRIDPSTRFALAGLDGTTRVAWKAAGAPVAQCVEVRRRGDVVTGLRSELLTVSAPISIEKGCP